MKDTDNIVCIIRSQINTEAQCLHLEKYLHFNQLGLRLEKPITASQCCEDGPISTAVISEPSHSSPGHLC